MFFKKGNKNEIEVLSPVDGVVKELSKVDDQVFSENMIGVGAAVTPETSTIVSPVKGIIKVAFPTGHAYGIGTKLGPELLIHIGVDTVEMDGKGFEAKVKVDDQVVTGTTLAEIDIPLIKKEAKSTDVIVLTTNESLGDFEVKEIAKGKIKRGEVLYKLVKK